MGQDWPGYHFFWRTGTFPLSFSFVLTIQSCPALCDPMDCNPPGFSVHEILQARILEWVAMCFSRGSSNPGIEHRYPALQADSLPSEPPGKPWGYRCLPLLGVCLQLDPVLSAVLHDDFTSSLIKVVHRIEIYLRFTGKKWRLERKMPLCKASQVVSVRGWCDYGWSLFPPFHCSLLLANSMHICVFLVLKYMIKILYLCHILSSRIRHFW